MRMLAPAIGGAAVIGAVVLVSIFRSDPEVTRGSDGVPEPASPPSTVNATAVRGAATELSAASTPPPAEAPGVGSAPSLSPSDTRAPLPGETAPTPMADMLPGRELPPGLVEGERAFAAEPVDAAWAPGAEADLLATFAQMPGLTLLGLQVECRSTMCRLELLQPDGGPAADGSRRFNILLDSVGLEPRWMMAIQGSSGPMRSVAYLWRDGLAPSRDCYKDGVPTPCSAEADEGGNRDRP